MKHTNSSTTLITMMTMGTITNQSMVLIRRINNIGYRQYTFRTIIRSTRIMVRHHIRRHVDINLTRPNITLITVDITNMTNTNTSTRPIRRTIIPNMVNPRQNLLIKRRLRTITFIITLLRFKFNRNMDNSSLRIINSIKRHFRLRTLSLRFTNLTNSKHNTSNNKSQGIFLHRIVRHDKRRDLTTQ